MKILDPSKVKRTEKIIKRLEKICASCGRKIKVSLYQNKTYRGGHYFGKIPLRREIEYWECPKCYWGY